MGRNWRSAKGVAAAVLLASFSILVRSPAADAAHGAPPPTLHVNCQAGPGGNGSARAPLNSLAEASTAALSPGQRLVFARGTVCAGTLDIHNSGAPGDPITVGAYGRGPAPLIAGSSPDAVLLQNASDVTVEDLEITNAGASGVARRGVHVVADGALVEGVTLEKLDIHDIDGTLKKDTGGSGGIQLDALGSAPAGRFDGVTITRNQIDNVSRSGIFVVGTQNGARPPANQPWSAGSTGVVISKNVLAHLAGDGIVATGTVGAVLEDNTVSDGNRAGTAFTNPHAICDAGIWAWNANSSLIQDNVVSAMEFNGCDGEGYDVDYNQDGTVVQDNISLGNGGGFILLCTDQNPHHGEVRDNLSVGDPASIEVAPCAIGSGNVGTLDGIRMYNNTFVAPHLSVDLELNLLSSVFNPGDFAFIDNILDATTVQSAAFPCGNACTNNLFFGLPSSGADPVAGNPRFKDPVVQGSNRLVMARGFKVGRTSPAVGAGAIIGGGAAQDFFGDPFPSGSPTIGFYQPGSR